MNLTRFVPALSWVTQYRRDDFGGDGLAGIIVAIVLVPQAMAYAMLAGLPPQAGLYSSVLPLLAYSLFGSSRTLAVGPVGLMSLMTATSLGAMNLPTSELMPTAALLALLSGIVLIGMRLLNLGTLVNFISHPVISGFTSAAAIVIAFSQLKHLLGIDVPDNLQIVAKTIYVATHFGDINGVTMTIGGLSIVLLLLAKTPFEPALLRWRCPPRLATTLAKTGPLIVIVGSTALVSTLNLDRSAAVNIVGAVPPGLPDFGLPSFNSPRWQQLFSSATLIAIVGFLESVSVAKALASRRREKIDPNQELLALGAANFGAAYSGGLPVAGGLGRSMVNFSAGARSPVASLITAALVALSLVFLTPYFYYLPKAALSAIIILAVIQLVDVETLKRVWQYDKSDSAALIITFIGVLLIGIEQGIVLGATVSIAFYLYRSSQPHIAVVGQLPGTEHFRNVERHNVETHPNILTIRIDENLYFANTNYLEDTIINKVVENPQVDHVVLICSAVNFIDTSALDSLETLIERLSNSGVTLHFAELKGPVLDKLKHTRFVDELPGNIYLSTFEAVQALSGIGNIRE